MQYISGHNRTLLYFTVQSSIIQEGKERKEGKEMEGKEREGREGK